MKTPSVPVPKKFSQAKLAAISKSKNCLSRNKCNNPKVKPDCVDSHPTNCIKRKELFVSILTYLENSIYRKTAVPIVTRLQSECKPDELEETFYREEEVRAEISRINKLDPNLKYNSFVISIAKNSVINQIRKDGYKLAK
jgi:hypothetical protein